ncbi:viral aspartic protease [Pseudooceanicola spongiae]|uniref:Viral aspartic protease n=1 Tax=Pseudooceanicola spongiae TaxID=2613965 RepID=A0A7L9WJP5_9RHOB|nr:viral aspartic protease [Pseudooceanicola spongiae]QOL79576.1 viral aspartic protease [Pseudooceanicola spongiae]
MTCDIASTPLRVSRRTAFRLATPLACLTALSACMGGSSEPVVQPTPTEISTPGIQHYKTNHNGYSRARIDRYGAEDVSIISQFEDPSPANPAGYKNLIALTEARYWDNMQLEVIAEVKTTEAGEEIVRVLRVTADQGSFDNVDRKGNLIASGKYYFRGNAEVYASVDGGALQRGVGTLENMVVDFDTRSVMIDLRTPNDPARGSQIETTMLVDNIPLDVVTGAFGGTVTLSTRDLTDTDKKIVSSGTLRGNLSGSEKGTSRLKEDLTTSGIFTVGSDGDRLKADGIFYGTQLNYAK